MTTFNCKLPRKGLLWILLTFLVVSCKNLTHNLNPAAITYQNEVRLGNSNYYLQLPGNFNLAEVNGKEGYLGYHILSKDTTLIMFGAIQVQRGNPIGQASYDTGKISAEIYHATLLGKQVTWTIKPLEKGYHAFLDNSQDLSALAFAGERDQLDSLIAIISTLTKK